MSKHLGELCTYCKIHNSIVSCRDGCGRGGGGGGGGGICFACLMTVPTGGQCKHCFNRFKSIHLKNHLQELRSQSWLNTIRTNEIQNIEEDSEKIKSLEA